MSISLQKGQKVNLKKNTNSLGEILINLNWNARVQKQGFFRAIFSNERPIDLDLGCLYEMKDGRKGAIQALGKHFGSLKNFPYISLDGDDRSGNVSTGENLRINGDKITEFKRILVYTFIYEGIANWKQADGIVTVKYPHAEDLVIQMDIYDTSKKMCSLAMLENVNDTTFSVEKIVSFYSGHQSMDRAFGWGMTWKAARKD